MQDADVALLLARAETLRGNQASAQQRLDVLGACVIRGRGWGLPQAWHAFADTIANPANTIYTYTTAAAVHAHLDFATRFAQPVPAVVLTAVETLAALWPYYDDQPKDRRPDRIVYNVNALNLAARHRLQLTVDDDLAELLAAREEQCWPYSTGPHRPNDMFHELLLCDGLLHMNRAAQEIAKRSVLSAWETHLGGTGTPTHGAHTLGSLLWGPAIAVVVLHRVGMRDEANLTLEKALTHKLYGAVHPRALAWYEVAHAQVAS